MCTAPGGRRDNTCRWGQPGFAPPPPPAVALASIITLCSYQHDIPVNFESSAKRLLTVALLGHDFLSRHVPWNAPATNMNFKILLNNKAGTWVPLEHGHVSLSSTVLPGLDNASRPQLGTDIQICTRKTHPIAGHKHIMQCFPHALSARLGRSKAELSS
jgi:hypothetical protein